MYTEEEYEERGFSLKKILFRFLIIVIIVVLIIYLMVKVIMPNLDSKKSTNSKTNSSEIMEKNSNIIKSAVISYYDDKEIPLEEKITVNQMINEGIITTLKEDKNNKLDHKNSFIEITKTDSDYALKINLKTASNEKYYVVYFGAYEYCEDKKLCEKDDSKAASDIAKNNDTKEDDNDYDENTPIKQGTEENNQENVKNNHQEEVKTLYKYEKVTPTKMSEWSEWTDWAQTTCTLDNITCDNSDEDCLLEVRIKKESNGTICYKSLRKRTKISSSYKTTRWSTNNDKDLLDNGWKLTGETKESK